MIRDNKLLVIVGSFAIAGVAVAACVQKAMPYLGVVDVGFLDMAIAGAQGYENPFRAAALKALDEKASKAVGDSNWKQNNYIGYVTYKVGNDVTLVNEDKPCDKKAIETTPKKAAGTSSSGSAGSYYWYGGGVWMQGGTCVYGCATPIVTVGTVEPA